MMRSEVHAREREGRTMSFLCFCSFFSGGGVRLEIGDPGNGKAEFLVRSRGVVES